MKVLFRLILGLNLRAWLLLVPSCALWFGCAPTDPYGNMMYEDTAPAWSPDGKWIAYAHFSYTWGDTIYPTGLYLVDTLGQNRQLIYEGLALNPDWAPDGETLAFGDGANIWTISLNDAQLARLTAGDGHHFPSWSPDGELIAYDVAFNDSSGTWIMGRDGSNKTRLGLGVDADWSPDGTRMVFTKGVPITSASSRSEVFTSKLDGTDLRQLTDSGKNSLSNLYPAWSPGGQFIAWQHERQVWIMDMDGRNQRKLIDGTWPAWSPDSRELVFSEEMEDRIALWIISRDGSYLKQLTR